MLPNSVSFFSQDWCGLSWTEWMGFDSSAQKFLSIIPNQPGLYRVREMGSKNLVYIGQTGKSLRTRLNTLRKYMLQDEMPFNDPHTAAPNLWAWRVENRMEFEGSATPQNLTKQEREGLECFLLWRYRQERGRSTLCNHGWFHPDYQKSGSRAFQKRGHKLTVRKGKPGSPSPPLSSNSLTSAKWGWSKDLPLTPQEIENHFNREDKIIGLYKLSNRTSSQILYIGQSRNLKSRLMSHSRKDWAGLEIKFSVHQITPESLNKFPRQLAELENDLIGIFYDKFKKVPLFQFKGHK